MTESEGYNFSTESNKYPSRFLFEISEDHFVRKSVLNKELIEDAKNFLIHDNKDDSEYIQYELGDLVRHRVWGLGEIMEVDSDKGEYQIKLIKTGIIKPINFEFRGLKKIKTPNNDAYI